MWGIMRPQRRLLRQVQAITSPFINAIYPYFSRKLNVGENRDKAYVLFRKIGLYFGGLLLLMTAAVATLSPYLISFYLGDFYQNSVTTIQIFKSGCFFRRN